MPELHQRQSDLSSWTKLGTIVLCVALAGLVALAGARGGLTYLDVPVVAICVALAFLIQWAAFVPAFTQQTERFFDLTGSLTYVALIVAALVLGNTDARSVLLCALILVWAVRLGSFLFNRVSRDGEDRRFRSIKPDLLMFLMTWSLQGLWVSLTLACALFAMTSTISTPLGLWATGGTLLWVTGFGIEVAADRQKQAFRADPANRNRFITTGLWSWSRHPNYFGEILLWSGIALITVPVLQGSQLVGLISPVFVWLLLTKISGIRMLEARSDKQWGEDPDYQVYKSRTPALMLRKPAT